MLLEPLCSSESWWYWWTILNVKINALDIRNRQPLQAVISDREDTRLDFILEFGRMCLKMSGTQGKRVKQLSKDSATSIYQTCYGLVDLSRHLLSEEAYEYVCLGGFDRQTRKSFFKITPGIRRHIFHQRTASHWKTTIHQAKLQLTLNFDSCSGANCNIHMCDDCNYEMNAAEYDLFDGLPSLENSVCKETMMTVIHIAGYIVRNNNTNSQQDTYHYFKKYGEYTETRNWGGLSTPGDNVCQWTTFGFTLFESIKHKVWRTSLTRIFSLISDFYNFNVLQSHSKILANIYLCNFCKISTPLQRKEVKQKAIKLS